MARGHPDNQDNAPTSGSVTNHTHEGPFVMSARILLGPGDQERDISGTLSCITAGCPQDDLLFQTTLAMQSTADRKAL